MNPTWEDLYQSQSPSSTDTTSLLIQCENTCEAASKIILDNLVPHNVRSRRRNSRSGGEGKVSEPKATAGDMALVHSYSRKREVSGSTTKTISKIEKSTENPVISHLTRARAAFEAEKQLWIDLKKFKDTNDRNIISYINGFYVTLSMSLNLAQTLGQDAVDGDEGLKSDMKRSTEAEKIERDLRYNLNIRVGDLNRYLKNNVLAKASYTRARTLNPRRGHAYNQLALISTNRLLQVYYYVRAVCSTEESILFAAENLKSQVTKFAAVGEQTNIVALFIPPQESPTKANPPPGFSNMTNHFPDDSSATNTVGLNPIPINPTEVSNWVYMVVIAIYSNNLAVVIEPLFEQSKLWIHQQLCGEDPFYSSGSKFNDYNLTKDSTALLPALDVLFDYVLCLTMYHDAIKVEDNQNGIKTEKQKIDHAKRRSHVLAALQFHQHRLLPNLKMSITSLLAMSDNFALGNNSSALKHDYGLLGFSHLSLAHARLDFDDGTIPGNKPNEFIILVKRICDKMKIVEKIIGSEPSPAIKQAHQFIANPNHFSPSHMSNPWSNGQHQFINNEPVVVSSSISPIPTENRVRKSRNAILQNMMQDT